MRSCAVEVGMVTWEIWPVPFGGDLVKVRGLVSFFFLGFRAGTAAATAGRESLSKPPLSSFIISSIFCNMSIFLSALDSRDSKRDLIRLHCVMSDDLMEERQASSQGESVRGRLAGGLASSLSGSLTCASSPGSDIVSRGV